MGINVRALRTDKGLTQADVAARVSASGCDGWVASTVAKVELGERQLRLDELGCLALALEVPYTELLRDTLLEQRTATPPDWSAFDRITAQAQKRMAARVRDYDRRTANRLGIPVDQLTDAARDLYEQPLADERDARLEDKLGDAEAHSAGVPPATATERSRALGHVTRDLLDELRDYLGLGAATGDHAETRKESE